MTLETLGLYVIFGVNITPYAHLSFGETVQNYDVLRGGVPRLPFTGDRFPDLPGVDGAFVHAQRASFTYDDRDSTTTPTRGRSARIFLEASARLLGSGTDYVKAGVEGVYLRPYFDDRLILVTHALFEALSGDKDTPFEVLPPGNHGCPGDGPELLRQLNPHKAAKLLEVIFVGQPRIGITEIGKPLDFRGDLSEFVALGCCQCPPLPFDALHVVHLPPPFRGKDSTLHNSIYAGFP